LEKSVCRTQRRGFSPRIKNVFSPFRTTSNSGPAAEGGRITSRVGSGGGVAARALATTSPRA
jgi:hypothetical protein